MSRISKLPQIISKHNQKQAPVKHQYQQQQQQQQQQSYGYIDNNNNNNTNNNSSSSSSHSGQQHQVVYQYHNNQNQPSTNNIKTQQSYQPQSPSLNTNQVSHPHQQLPHVPPIIFHEIIPNSFKLFQTPSKTYGQNYIPLGHTLAEIMRDMTPQTRLLHNLLFLFYK
jgi:hypothetical protein